MTTVSRTAAPRRRPRWKRWRIVVGASLAALVIAAVAGASYERHAARRDARLFPAPGQLVDVGGRRLHLLCIGRGSPVVLFEGSGFGTSVSFTDARTSIATQTRVCSYDRMGTGWSDPGPSEISAGLLTEDLRRLLDAAQMREPLIIVASSIGGVTAELFARRYPDRVAGLVFLDAASSEGLTRVRERDVFILGQFACGMASAAGTVGLVRFTDPWDFRDEPAGRGARGAALMYGAKPWNMLCTFVRGGQTTVHELETAPPLRRDVPLTMLSAETRENLLPPALARLIGYGGRGHSRCAGDPPATGAALGAWKVESRAGERSLDRQQSAAGSGGRGARNGPAEAGHHSSQWVIA